MQPYFFPYIGYFQLIAAADKFVIYDNIKFTKKGWINRNRILLNGSDTIFSLPIKKDSDFLDIYERKLADDFDPKKLLNKFKGSYKNAPYFKPTFLLLEEVMFYEDKNLFNFLKFSLIKICSHLEIGTEFLVSSQIGIDHLLKGQNKVIALCKKMDADIYINAIGGLELYQKTVFFDNDIDLKFIKSSPIEYRQFEHPFISSLSIIDVLMFNPIARVKDLLDRYTLN